MEIGERWREENGQPFERYQTRSGRPTNRMIHAVNGTSVGMPIIAPSSSAAAAPQVLSDSGINPNAINADGGAADRAGAAVVKFHSYLAVPLRGTGQSQTEDEDGAIPDGVPSPFAPWVHEDLFHFESNQFNVYGESFEAQLERSCFASSSPPSDAASSPPVPLEVSNFTYLPSRVASTRLPLLLPLFTPIQT